MEFKTTLNDAKVVIEYDEGAAADQDGNVNECEVRFNGQIITLTVAPEKYWAYLIDCEAHYKKHIESERNEDAMFRAECRASDKACAANEFFA